MRFRFITLFPALIEQAAAEGILGRAQQDGQVEVSTIDLREFGEGRHKTVDDTPYGGGSGMVMKAGPAVKAIELARELDPETRVVMLTPQGARFAQPVAQRYSGLESITFLCGRYEGFDERIRDYVDEEVSLGDFVLMGGEVAALAMLEATARLVPGVLGDHASTVEESMSEGLLEYPQYTRPREFRGSAVPEVLLGGNHAEIAAWRRAQALKRTRQRRPDLIAGAERTGGGDAEKEGAK